jgi:hypothetical protein
MKAALWVLLLVLALLPGASRGEGGDRDRDGLDDALERRLVETHLPWFRIDPGNIDPRAAAILDAGDPRETLLGTGPWDRLGSSCAWPVAPHRRGLALARVTPAAPYTLEAYATQADGRPGRRRFEISSDLAQIEAQSSGSHAYLIARVSLLFANDCGGSGRAVGWLGRGVNAHRGDTEELAFSLVRDPACLPPEQGGSTPGGDGWRVGDLVIGAHVGAEFLGLPWEIVFHERVDACDFGASFRPDWPVRYASDPGGVAASAPNVLWPALWKHGIYPSRDACNEGMWLPFFGPVEECREGGFLQAYDVANVGEPDAPIHPDDPLNEPGARVAGRFATLFPGEDVWAVHPPSVPGGLDGGFCGGFDRARVLAANRRCMGEPMRHKIEGDVSPAGDRILRAWGGCPDGDRCHRLLVPYPPGLPREAVARPPPAISSEATTGR